MSVQTPAAVHHYTQDIELGHMQHGAEAGAPGNGFAVAQQHDAPMNRNMMRSCLNSVPARIAIGGGGFFGGFLGAAACVLFAVTSDNTGAKVGFGFGAAASIIAMGAGPIIAGRRW